MKHKLQIAVTLLFLGFVAWWLSFQHVVTHQGLSVQWFGGTYGIMALIGSLIGFTAARKWGGFKTALGRALLFFSLGLLAQEAGQLIYTYYIYGAKIQIPYPSWGDAAYFGSVIIYIVAALLLSRISGVRFSLRHTRYKVVAIVVPAILLAASYSIFLYHHQYDTAKPLTVILDFGYPIGQALYISIAITAYILSLKMLGGIMKRCILMIILALFVQYVADFTFVYQSNRGTYLSGRFDDLFYLISYFAMAMALISFHTAYADFKRLVQTPSLEVAQPSTEPTPPIADSADENDGDS
jgi:hypothetical protein